MKNQNLFSVEQRRLKKLLKIVAIALFATMIVSYTTIGFYLRWATVVTCQAIIILLLFYIVDKYNELLQRKALLQLSEVSNTLKKGVSIITILPNSPQAYTKVSFELSYRDWCQLEKLKEWEDFCNHLDRVQTQESQKYH
jgi:hypothetical protein